MEKVKDLDKNVILKSLFFIVFLLFFPLFANLFKHLSLAKYFHAIDFIFLSILGSSFFFKFDLKKYFLDKTAIFLMVFLILSRISLAFSIESSYKSYPEILKLLLASFLFFLCLSKTFMENKHFFIKGFFCIVLTISFFQTIIGITQFFLQRSLGLKVLGEAVFSNNISTSAMIKIQGGRWFFDQLFHLNTSDCIVRAHGLFFHPNIFGGFLFLAILMSFYVLYILEKKSHKILIIGFIMLQMFALFITFSRAALFATFIAIFIFLSLMMIKKYNVKWIVLGFCIPSIICISLLYNQISQRGGVVNYNTYNKASDAVRIMQQNVAFAMIKKEPLKGVGYRNFIIRIKDFTDKPYRDNVHNIYLLIGAESGVIALLAFLAFVISLFIRSYVRGFSPLSITFLAILIGFLFIGLVDHYLLSRQIGRIMFFSISGIIASNLDLESLDFHKA
jgi:O-antigen ligase